MKSKSILLLIFWFHFQYESKAQDLIVLNSKDSINCKILKDNNEIFVEVAMLVKNNIELANINLSDIASIRKNYFVNHLNLKPICFDSIFTKDGEVIIGKITEDKKDWYINYILPNQSKHSIPYTSLKKVIKCPLDSIKNSNKISQLKLLQTNNSTAIQQVFDNKKYRISLNGILGIFSGINHTNIITSPRNHINQLKLNWGFDLSFHRSINKRRNLLLGLKFSSLYASARSQNIQLTTPSNINYNGELLTNINVNSFGPNLLIKLGKGKSLHSYALLFGISLVYYNEISSISDYNLAVSGLAISQNLNFLYDYKMSKNFSVGCNLGYEGGTINAVFVNDNGNQFTKRLAKNNATNIGRIGFSIGGRYWF